MSFFSSESLMALADAKREEFLAAEPFPHIVIDNFLSEIWAEQVLASFPQPQSNWTKFNNLREQKYATSSSEALDPFLRSTLDQFNTAPMLSFLEGLTGVRGLIPDPYFYGGGIHLMKKGGFLKIHEDFNLHPQLQLYRRINLIVYLNKNWKEEYGGHLQIWDAKMTKCHKQILPIFNRCVIFRTDMQSPHGLPDPIQCPDGETRKSIAFYYYTVELGAHKSRKEHSTIFRNRPNAKVDLDMMSERTTRSTKSPRQLIRAVIKKIVGRRI